MLLFLDIESYYDQAYSLKRMDPASYILDRRFEAIMMGVAFEDGRGGLIDGPDIPEALSKLEPQRTTTVTYNALFDNSILAWRYGFVPARMVDALGMARGLLCHRLRKFGLADVADCLGVGQKTHELNEVKGLHREQIRQDRDLWRRFGTYCSNDTALLRAIYIKLHKEFPREEYEIMDSVLRTCIEPRFQCDIQLLQQHLRAVRDEKIRLCAAVGVDRDRISGNKTFLELLTATGVEIQTKPGKNGNEIPAIAKTDKFMTELLEHENPEVQCLASARLGIKSTLEEQRTERLINIASLPWTGSTPLIPIPLKYSGAHTWRLAGDWKINMQNLPSARMGNPVLRRSLMAPPGHTIVVGDLAQIEARLNAWFCKETMLLDEFKNKLDPYSQLASQIFHRAVDKSTFKGVARHIGKAAILGCGYGMGAPKFYDSVLRQSRTTLSSEQFKTLSELWTPQAAKLAVDTYRERYHKIPRRWALLRQHLHGAFVGDMGEAKPYPITIGYNKAERYGYVRGPGGQEMRYGTPQWLENGELWYWMGGVPHKLYGAALLENIIQFLARMVQMEIMLRLRSIGLQMIHTVHDELVFMVPTERVDDAMANVKLQMTTPPDWCASLPLEADVSAGQRYGDCK
jgi:DNA polymerase